MKRKIEEKILNWKAKSNGKTALLIDGARRVGKSFIVEEFAKQNYKTSVDQGPVFNFVRHIMIELF